MNWFYANAGQQVGPVNDADLERLVREGVVQPTTLVWNESMANWQPYATVAPGVPTTPGFGSVGGTVPAGSSIPPGQVACGECGKIVPVEDTMQINGLAICAACKPIYLQKLREGTVSFQTTAPGDLRYAGFWIRFVAKLIDSIIVGIPIMILYLIAVFGFGVTAAARPGTAQDMAGMFAQLGVQLGVQFVGILLGGLYTVFFVAKYGATPGKMAVGLRIVMADGRKLSVGRAVGRYFAEMVSGIICYIGYILAGFDDQKRTLHDHMCSTRVVYK